MVAGLGMRGCSHGRDRAWGDGEKEHLDGEIKNTIKKYVACVYVCETMYNWKNTPLQ